jgi:hypothetical protein
MPPNLESLNPSIAIAELREGFTTRIARIRGFEDQGFGIRDSGFEDQGFAMSDQ